jgi:type IV pilus assembly protein PilB
VDCKQQIKYEKKVLEDCGFSVEQIATAKLSKGAGCRTCNGSGYKGRVALYEVMRFTDTLKEMVLQGASTAELKLGAIKNGMMTLRMSGIKKISDGVTTPEEVMRVTMGD